MGGKGGIILQSFSGPSEDCTSLHRGCRWANEVSAFAVCMVIVMSKACRLGTTASAIQVGQAHTPWQWQVTDFKKDALCEQSAQTNDRLSGSERILMLIGSTAAPLQLSFRHSDSCLCLSLASYQRWSLTITSKCLLPVQILTSTGIG